MPSQVNFNQPKPLYDEILAGRWAHIEAIEIPGRIVSRRVCLVFVVRIIVLASFDRTLALRLKILSRLVCALPFILVVLRPLIGVTSRVKHELVFTDVNKAHLLQTWFGFIGGRTRHDQWPPAVLPQLMFEQNIARVQNERMSDSESYDR
ncbi:hypothetical protein AC628_00115 [Bradyrhizobium sp. NAS96.2]|nr:hypothetical protein AC628_00115 [Bradyrhizobium sp. NAS96.2]